MPEFERSSNAGWHRHPIDEDDAKMSTHRHTGTAAPPLISGTPTPHDAPKKAVPKKAVPKKGTEEGSPLMAAPHVGRHTPHRHADEGTLGAAVHAGTVQKWVRNISNYAIL